MLTWLTHLPIITVLLLGLSPVAAVTGCSCNGLSWWRTTQLGPYPPTTEFNVLFWDSREFGESYRSKANGGYCMQDDRLTPATAISIADGIRRKVDTLWVNHTGIDAWCYLGGYAGNVEECVTYISNTKRNQMREHPEQMAPCNYPSANFIPTSSQCQFECSNGYVRCGSDCINPITHTCSSGRPQTIGRRRGLTRCPPGLTLCPVVNSRGWECIDTTTDLDSCGGCLEDGGVDCTVDVVGALDVACLAGRCQVSRCAAGFVIVNGTCIAA